MCFWCKTAAVWGWGYFPLTFGGGFGRNGKITRPTNAVEIVYNYNEIGAFAVLWFISDIGLELKPFIVT